MAQISTDHLCNRRTQQRRRLWQMLRRGAALCRQRRALSRLSCAQLRDVGVTEQAAKAEAARKICDVPAHWRQ